MLSSHEKLDDGQMEIIVSTWCDSTIVNLTKVFGPENKNKRTTFMHDHPKALYQ